MNEFNLALGHISKIKHITKRGDVFAIITYNGKSYNDVFMRRKDYNKLSKGNLIKGFLIALTDDIPEEDYQVHVFKPTHL